MDYCKAFVIRLLRILVRILFFLPIHSERIVLSSHVGAGYSCNPKYISEYLAENFPQGEFELIWAFKEPDNDSSDGYFKSVKYNSLKWLLSCVTAKVIITNDGAIWIPRRKGQLFIDTWHGGGCYKKVANGSADIGHYERYRTRVSSSEVNLYLSSSSFFSENVVRSSFQYSGEILNCGMPRNDLLFEDAGSERVSALRQKISEKYEFDADSCIVLFAPTWRRNGSRTEALDAVKVKEAAERRFGRKVVLLGRGHQNDKELLESNVVDVTSYPDMQELLAVSDMLITDYSSCMWDFSFTGKPCLLFTPDLDSYRENPGFDCEIETWGFPVCETNRLLTEAIMNFDQSDYLTKMKAHHDALGSYETGHATEAVCEYIAGFCGGRP